jgi:hypothetical protein
MAKTKSITNDLDEFEEENDTNLNEFKYKEDICEVIWVKPHAFAIMFQGYGISFHTNEEHFLDTSKIKDIIKVNYVGEIGNSDFKIFPVYD